MLGLKPKHRKYIRPVLGFIILIAGLVFLIIPFIPLGYILVITGGLFLAPVVHPIGRLLEKLRKNDRKDRIGKAEQEMDKVEEKVDEVLITNKHKNEGTGKDKKEKIKGPKNHTR